jgi:DNA polymerase III subunit delta'
VTFADILGHAPAVGTLRTAAKRPASAYLLYGPTGIGKRRVADAFATRLLCAAPPDDDVCGTCSQCTRVRAGTHPDLLIVERDPERRDVRIEQARELTRWLSLRPMMAPRKVALLDGAHQLNPAGQNALLKTLEEPPGAAVIVLTATGVTNLLPTVRSRCQQIRLDPLPSDAVARVLRAQGIDDEVARILAARSGGSIGRALALADDGLDALRTRVLGTLADLPERSADDLCALAVEAGRGATEPALEIAVAWYRDLLGLILGAGVEALRNPDASGPLRAAAARLTPDAVLRALEEVCDTLTALSRNANRVLAIETMLLDLRRIERSAGAHR